MSNNSLERTVKLTCPHCNQRAMGIWRKWSTSVASAGRCANCDGHIGIPSWSFYAMLAIAAAIAIPAFFFLPERWWGVAAILLVAAAQGMFQIFVVPIERREA